MKVVLQGGVTEMGAASFLLFAIIAGAITYALIYNRIKRQLQGTEKERSMCDVESPSQVGETKAEVTLPPVEEYPQPTSREPEGKQLSDESPLSSDNEEDDPFSFDGEILAGPEEPPQPKGTTPRRLEPSKRDPSKRGGRPRGPVQISEPQTSRERKSRDIKPEIVCWQRERAWWLGVEVPEELLDNALEVLQDDTPLSQDEHQDGCWRLEKITGDVFVRWNEVEHPISLNKSYILFRLGGQNQGRKVHSPSTGHYLAIVPEDWERDEERSGPAPVEPAPVVIPGYRAHYFDVEKDETIAFRTPDAKPVVIEAKSSRFELIGNRLEDAREDIGPLFGEKPPQIRTTNNTGWKDVVSIVVGEEGRGKGKWRMAFHPGLEQIEQDLPAEVANRKGGWYFLRFYDRDGDLIESLDFRFLIGLKEIKKLQLSPLPSEEGHTPVHVEFLHDPEYTVKSVDHCADIKIQREDGKTTVTIPSDPAYDETSWLVDTERLNILVERVWWACGEDESEPSTWIDKPVILTREDLKPTSHRALWLRLPRRRWTDAVRVGFSVKGARPYLVKANELTLCVPLRHFEGTEEWRTPGRALLGIWIDRQNKRYTTVVGKLVVRVGCKQCDLTFDGEEDVLKHVASAHMDAFFSPLTYKEMQKLMPSLYPTIYKCSYCGFYVSSDDPNYPTSAICKHIEEDCSNVDRSKGPVEIRYEIIDDPDEIKENIIKDLQRRYRCNRCGMSMPADRRSHHLTENHKKELYEIR